MNKLFKFVFIAVFAAVTGYNVYKSQSVMNGMSEFALANVEALAGDELGANNCYATICYNKCKAYIYESPTPCNCSLCTGL